jgi:hypothetical protein
MSAKVCEKISRSVRKRLIARAEPSSVCGKVTVTLKRSFRCSWRPSSPSHLVCKCTQRRE